MWCARQASPLPRFTTMQLRPSGVLLVLILANPNVLLLIKDVRMVKNDGRLELEIRTHNRDSFAKLKAHPKSIAQRAADLTSITPPPPQPTVGRRLLVGSTLAAAGATVGASASAATGRPLSAATALRLIGRPFSSGGRQVVQRPRPLLPEPPLPLR